MCKTANDIKVYLLAANGGITSSAGAFADLCQIKISKACGCPC